MNINYRNKFLIKSKTSCYVVYKPQRDADGHKLKDDDNNQVFSPNKPKYFTSLKSLCDAIFVPYIIQTTEEDIRSLQKFYNNINSYISSQLKGIDLLGERKELFIFDKDYRLTSYEFGYILEVASKKDGKYNLNKKGKVIYGENLHYKKYDAVVISILENEFRQNNATNETELYAHVKESSRKVLKFIEEIKEGKI